jgi:hypothetical protein
MRAFNSPRKDSASVLRAGWRDVDSGRGVMGLKSSIVPPFGVVTRCLARRDRLLGDGQQVQGLHRHFTNETGLQIDPFRPSAEVIAQQEPACLSLFTRGAAAQIGNGLENHGHDQTLFWQWARRRCADVAQQKFFDGANGDQWLRQLGTLSAPNIR